MVVDHILSSIEGKEGMQAYISIPPINQISLRPNVIFDMVEGKKVLHLGCTDHLELIDAKIENGTHLHKQLSFVASECLGIDINDEAIKYLQQHGINNIIYADITDPNVEQIKNEKWDFLVMGEVLEHIDNPVLFLNQIAENYRGSIEQIIITVPNALGLYAVNNAINHGFEGINYDHRYWFTPFTITQVAYRAGLTPVDLTMCLYEMSVGFLKHNSNLLREKPLLLDSIVLTCKV